MLEYNPYLQGNPLMGNITPEMQEAARQRAIFNAGAAMLGSAGRGESFVSGLSQAGQMYGGSLDQMMNEGLRYQSARQQQEHQKELMGLEREKLKQDAELQQKANETRIKAAQIGSAAGLAQAEVLRKQMEQQELARKLNESIGSRLLLGQLDAAAPRILEGKGYLFDKSNPLAAGAAALLNRRMSGISGPLSLEQQAQIASQLPERERTTWALQQNIMQPDKVRAAYPERFMQNSLGIMGGSDEKSTPQVSPVPQTIDEARRISEINRSQKIVSERNDKVIKEAKEALYGPRGGWIFPGGGGPQMSKPPLGVGYTPEKIAELEKGLAETYPTLSEAQKAEAQGLIDIIQKYKTTGEDPNMLNRWWMNMWR